MATSGNNSTAAAWPGTYRSYVSSLINKHPSSALYLRALTAYLEQAPEYPSQQRIDDFFERPLSPASDRGLDNQGRCWMRHVPGLIAPDSIERLGLEHGIRPEAFIGHLELERATSDLPTSFELPSVSLADDTIYHIQCTTLGSFPSARLDKPDAEIQAKADAHIQTLEEQLFVKKQYQSERVRRLDIHNDRYFTVEHRVTFTIGKGGIALLLTDNIRTDRSGWLAKWVEFDNGRRGAAALHPAVSYSINLSENAPHDSIMDEIRDKVGDIFLPGNTPIDPEFPIQVLYGVIGAAISSWSQVLNMLDHRNSKLSGTRALAAIEQLRCNICFLIRLREHIVQSQETTRRALSNHPSRSVVASQHSLDDDLATGIKSSMMSEKDHPLLYAHSILLGRCGRLQKSFITISTLLASAVQAKEAQRSIEQTKRVEYVTKLAYLFLPLSYVSSVFGMNVVEIQDHNPSLWTFFVAS